MQIILQAMQDDYIEPCDIHQWIKNLERLDDCIDNTGFYGFNIHLQRVSTESPYLYVAYKKGAGFFASVRLSESQKLSGRDAQVFIAKQSDDLTSPLIFRADEWVLKIPRGLFIDKEKTIEVVLHFCRTGSLSPRVDWTPYEDLAEDIFADADECEAMYRRE